MSRERESLPLPSHGPGFRRMQERLGPERMEALRQDNLRRQLEARAMISGEMPELERDRDTYSEYPPPKRSKRRRKKK